MMFLPPRIKKAKVKRQKAYLFSRARFEIVTRIAMSWRHSSSRGADFRNELIHSLPTRSPPPCAALPSMSLVSLAPFRL